MEINWKDLIHFKWFKRLYFLYIFGFVVSLRPTTPFHYEFLLSNKNFSENDVQENILPVWFYSTSVQLLPVYFLMEYLKFNPFIIISCLTGLVATCLFIWTESWSEMQVAQAFYGSMSAAEVAYYVSIYSHSDHSNFQRLTSYVRAAPLAGKIISSLLAQLFISQNWLSYKELHYFTFASFILSIFLTIVLPPVVYKKSEKPSNLTSVFTNLKKAYPNKYVVKWSLWSILTICGYHQVSVYVQPLWKTLQKKNDISAYNGFLDGTYAVFALFGTICGGYARFDWKYNGDLILTMTSLVEAFMLLFMSQIEQVVLNCIFYVIFGFLYHFVMTIVCGEIAKFLQEDCFGLVFGFIALGGSVLSSAMVCLFNDKVGLRLDSEYLFMAYGYYHLSVSILFIIIGLSYWFAKHTYQ
ncbi:folate-like transporter 3 [Tribolium castaneum]|uniref:Folate-like transporter 2 n=1 Tax=Tribolium castaneum TaxID=7070 RepID=D6WDS5_TRICA|nr:PREDICTED: folate-like transporter 3 [Tribolium castaneum]EFA00821.1 Folate-like transporter 2 [Tribolium castaneum]|eukprot:XP_971677.1 PREDICTED: folate-like transporter 3 [Tribolium castaneum]